MPIYEIEQYELHAQKYRVEADSPAEAIGKLLDGGADVIDGGLEYCNVAEEYGMPSDANQDLTDELLGLDVDIADGVIPSIRSIKQVSDE